MFFAADDPAPVPPAPATASSGCSLRAPAPAQSGAAARAPASEHPVHNRRFQWSWKTSYPWIEYDRQADSVTCAKCREAHRAGLLTSASKADGAFISVGFRSWNKARERFGHHESTQTHLSAVARLSETAAENPTQLMLTSGKQKEMEASREALDCIFDAVAYLAGQGLPFRRREEETGNFNRFLDQAEKRSPALRAFRQRKHSFTSNDVQNEIIELMATALIREIAATVRRDNFAIMVDETRDIAGTEQVSICLRSVTADLEVEEQFVGLYAVDSTTASSLVTVVKDALLRLGLDIKNLRGQCYDGASNMSGAFRG